MRPKERSSACASEDTRSVLASPGTPTKSAWPRAASVTSIASTTVSCPTTVSAIARRSRSAASAAFSSKATSDVAEGRSLAAVTAGACLSIKTPSPARQKAHKSAARCYEAAVLLGAWEGSFVAPAWVVGLLGASVAVLGGLYFVLRVRRVRRGGS